MTDDDKALVKRLRGDWPEILVEKHWMMDSDAIDKQREEAAHRIEALSAENELLKRSAEYWEQDAKRYAANQEYWCMEERAAIVAWLHEQWVSDATDNIDVLDMIDGIKAGEHLKCPTEIGE